MPAPRVTSSGYRPDSVAVSLAPGMVKPAVVSRTAVALPEGLVATRRNLRRGVDEATNVEATDRADLQAQLDRSPGTIGELPMQIDGVRLQPLSAGSAGSGIRIRGMPGRYTKVLMDGLPLLGATPEGQDLGQIPVLDVQRVEIVKGVSSAMYGPTAVGGVVNIVSAAVGAQADGERAVMALTTDAPVKEETIEKILELDGFSIGRSVDL